MEIQSRQQEGQVQISLSCTFSGISKLENINESYNLKIGMMNENETISYDYAINNNVKFKDSVSIESLNNDTALLLNDCDDTTLQNLMKAIIERIDSVNRYITSNLGLKESENPLIYSSPLTMLNTIIYNSASDSVSEVEDDLFEMEKQVHNDKFVRYEGTNKRSSQVNALIDTTLRNNLSESDYSKKIRITLDGIEILGKDDTQAKKVETTNEYQVDLVYDNNSGLITEIKIITKNTWHNNWDYV